MTTRRRFLRHTACAVAAAALRPIPVIGQARPRVVVIGGGPGGGTAATRVAKDSSGTVDVVLIEPERNFTSCFHSNLVIGGFRSFESITHPYDRLTDIHGIRVIEQFAASVDRDRRKVTLADGSSVTYDRLVMAPGIELIYESVPGWGKAHEEVMPHGWKAGRQTRIIMERMAAVPDGGVVVVAAPPMPYRCPPGPYERVSMLAHLLKSTGRTRCKIVILDAKPTFAKQALFLDGWQNHYPGMIEWHGPAEHGGLKHLDPATGTVATANWEWKNAALVNVIPAQRAGHIAQASGLTDATGWCPIEAESMRSKIDPNIYVLGDSAAAGDMPKSGYAANSQAKVAAADILHALVGEEPRPVTYSNMCYSLIAADDAVKIGARYVPRDGRITAASAYISTVGETAEVRRQTQVENRGWYSGLVADMFADYFGSLRIAN